ncbi:TPA: lipopolysaccharide assembly protein LapA domain-containing protein, partial [Escherichia coli]
AGVAIGWLICGLFWLRVRVSLARAERKIKRLENQLSPATDVAVAPHSSASKE